VHYKCAGCGDGGVWIAQREVEQPAYKRGPKVPRANLLSSVCVVPTGSSYWGLRKFFDMLGAAFVEEGQFYRVR
jgi:hypothetical protein